MNDRPLISVIVPAYNHERFVGEALVSLMAQTYQRLELVVLDDGSTDATYARIEDLRAELERRFVRVELGTKGHEGTGRTISRCLQLARSDLVYMLDSDDIAHPDAIECLLPCMESPEVALAVGDNEYIDEDGRPVTLERDGERHATLLAYHLSSRANFVIERDFGSYVSLIEGNYVPNGWLLRRSCVSGVGGYAGELSLDDWSLLLRLVKKYRIRFTGSVLGKYRVHDKNTVTVHEESLFIDTARLLLQERAYCREHGFESAWSTYAHHVFERITPEEITSIVESPISGENWWEERRSRIEDLARIGKRETDFLRVSSALEQTRQKHLASIAKQETLQDLQEVERSRLLSLLDDAVERFRLAESVHENERERWRRDSEALNALVERHSLTEIAHQRERERLSRGLAASTARLSALEASRSWRWTGPIRRGLNALGRTASRKWEVCLEPPKPDPDSLGGVIVSGWAFHRDSPVARVEISVEGRQYFAAEYGIERPDVVAAFPKTDVGRPGFSVSIHVIEGPVTLQIELLCLDGRRQVVTRLLQRSHAMNDIARELYGAPIQFVASALWLVRDLVNHGGVGRYIWQSRRIRGWIRGHGEAEALAKASESLGDSPVIVEIGTFLGCSTVLLAGPCKRRGSGRVHCVDTFSPTGDDAALPIYRTIAESLGMSIRQLFDKNIYRAGLSDWITVHEMRSDEAARRWDTPIDMLFLDGDVSIAGSREIFQAWSPFLRRGGILAINGTVERPSRIGSYQVVREFVRPPNYEDVRRVDHITFARKSTEG